MASNKATGSEQFKKLCELRELFHGRFTDEEAAILLEINNGDVRMAAMVAMIANPATLTKTLNIEKAKLSKVEHARKKVRGDPSHRDILKKAKEGKIDTSSCLFACGPCKHFWWRKTPSRKEVSKCNKCQKKYDPVPAHLTWGWAEFVCTNCQHPFGGWCAMYMTSPCFKCGTRNLPMRIVPPESGRERRAGRSQHACSAWDCAGNRAAQEPPQGTPEHAHRCVHPQSRRANGLSEVVHPSDPHCSSGDTVATFLSQRHMEEHHKEFFRPPLPSVTEESPDMEDVQ